MRNLEPSMTDLEITITFITTNLKVFVDQSTFIYKIIITPHHLEWIIANNYSMTWQICECEQFAKENNIQQSFSLF